MEESVFRAEYVHSITEGSSVIEGFEHIEVIPGKHLLFFDGSRTSMQRFTILPYHAFDLIEVEKISRKQFEKEMQDEQNDP